MEISHENLLTKIRNFKLVYLRLKSRERRQRLIKLLTVWDSVIKVVNTQTAENYI